MVVLTDYVRAAKRQDDEYRKAEAYYEGSIGEKFTSVALKNALRKTKYQGTHNYCRVVVDAVANRLEIANIVASTDKAQKFVDEVWKENELDLESNVSHQKTCVYGDGYAFVWPDEEGKWQIAYNSPRTAGLVYDPENPRKKLYAVKMWEEPGTPESANKKRTRMNVYTKDAIYKYATDGTDVSEGADWTALGSEDNPFGEVPVFHFRTHRPFGKPEHKEAYGPQDDINKLLATHFHTIDYQGARQRWALSADEPDNIPNFSEDDTERENVNGLQNGPGQLWLLDNIKQVGEFAAAEPKNFWDPISSLKQSIATLTDTPFHVLEKPMNVSGGEALRVAEATLLKKVGDRQVSFGVTWREIFDFVLKAEGIKASLEVKWNLVESLDALGRWDVMLKKRNAGLSMRQVLREEGYTEEQIEQIMTERLEEMAADGNTSYGRSAAPTVRVSTDDNENFGDRNGLTEQAKVNGGRKEEE